ncbi:hypothetical protein QFZ63_005078 [Streptomyces sp. B3I7]|uniref:hypothetical protein n=1 Tax=Streptomyces sp. B3I7 TaxID=3042269 RepID=UPI002780530C|nr:hypothetical protein [Streptomyces sp. B3I7]MDQ0813364.1 hypothetical protein [Streptomyces sp. B3I7]
MRALPARHLAAPALCAVLLFGTAGPAAMAADGRSGSGPSGSGTSASAHGRTQVPVPGADGLRAQVRSLSTAGGVLTPVTDLLDTALKADNGQLPASLAAELGRAAKDAIREAAAAPSTVAQPAKPVVRPTSPAGSASLAKPADPAKPVQPAKTAAPSEAASPGASASAGASAAPGVSHKPATPAAPPLSKTAAGGEGRGHGDRARGKDTRQDALTDLQEAVDALVKASTSGDVGQVVPAVSGAVNNLVDVLLATLTDGSLTDTALADTALTGPALIDPALIDPDLAGLISSASDIAAGTLPAPPSLPSDLILPAS